DDNGDPIQREGNAGGYLVLDKTLYQSEEREWGSFLQFGQTIENLNEVDLYAGGGITCRGCLKNRSEDHIGIAVAYAFVSDELIDATNRDRAETTLELTYRAKITEHLTLQPDIQWIFNPGANPDFDDAFVTGLRFELAL
ncbi:MAG: carbohydrate porin, partial [Candidatus Omnitrophica bacterium]|nr:carbohydrate porin [Candidatus Omnitrophota bacterium]